MNGPSIHEPKIPEIPSSNGRSQAEERHRRKERERVDKWMKMMKVVKRDQGGNILEWGWRTDGQGSKVGRIVWMVLLYKSGLTISFPKGCIKVFRIDGGWLLGGLLQRSMLIKKQKARVRARPKRKI
jgi:hypothetical protein